MNNINELIQVKQVPVIEEKLKSIGAEAQKKIDMALSMPCTIETKTAVKKIRASLNADFKLLEDARKTVEKQIDEALKPFRDSYKMYITAVYKPADEQLKAKIAELEDEEKFIKFQNLRTYFDEVCKFNHCDVLEFERVIAKVDLSKSESFYKKQIDSAIIQSLKDLEVIDNHEHSAELMVEYIKTFDLAEALVTVTNRHMQMADFTAKAENKIAKVEAENEAVEKVDEALSAPEIVEDEDETIYSMTFTVQGTKTQLCELKEFLKKVGLYNE